jgi:pimeloyl-ACP methyl ester carboxylesterase
MRSKMVAMPVLKDVSKCFAAVALVMASRESHAEANGNAKAFERADCEALNFSDSDLGEGVECGWLTVPEFQEAPGRNIRLAVVIARATSKVHAKEPVLYLHGGPGIATLDVVPRALRGEAWPLLRDRHDLVFFDQRGTGRSGPAICSGFDRTLAELAAKGISGGAKAATQLAAARKCRTELHALQIDPASYSSSEIAADVEALRDALGIDRWNIFATSFGSLPAADVMRRWPETVRAVLLDSAFPPNSTNRAELMSATAASFAAFQRRCDTSTVCREQFPNLRRSAAAIGSRLDRSPIPTKGGRITGEAFRDALWTLMVDGSTAAYLPELLRNAGNGDDDLVRRFVSVFGNSGYFGDYAHAQSWLVNCHDVFPRPSRDLLVRAIGENPDLAADVKPGAQDAMCDTLQPLHADESFYRAFGNQIPTLILFGEFDPATPRTDAVSAREFFGNATLIEIDGASHAPFYTDACTKQIAVAFFSAPSAPVDQSCLASRTPFAFATELEFDEFASSLAE